MVVAPANDLPLVRTFTDGVRAAAPVVLGYLPIGFAFGVLARTNGLSPLEVLLMSVLVYAGSAQFIGTGMIGVGTASPTIIFTTFLVNLRHLLMSTALVPSLRQHSPLENSLLAFGITDETFAVNTAITQGQPAAKRFVAGLHVASHGSWAVASLVGALAWQFAGDTTKLGLDFALSAMFVGLLVPNLRGSERGAKLGAALTAAAIAVGSKLLFPTSDWSIITATVIAATLGVILSR